MLNRYRFFQLPIAVRLLLLTQMIFNIGFYLVVPFLAVHMTESLAASGAMIGFVLGLRTFSQQGLFFIGGGLTDRFGVRPILLIGIAIRVCGFIMAGFSANTIQLMISVALIGFAAALFSPAAEAALAISGHQAEQTGIMSRTEVFALDALFSRAGALIGPIVGTALMKIGFSITSWVAALIFAVLFVLHLLFIPAVKTTSSTPVVAGWVAVLRNRMFLVFALAYSSYLVAYNQQYLSLPVELTRATGSQDSLGWMFVFSSILILSLQLPITSRTKKLPRSRSLAVGFGITAAGFLVLVIAAPLHPATGIWALAPALLMLLFMHCGQMIAVPIARDLVGVLAKEKNLGAYFGFLNTFGGIAVLVSSIFLGSLLDAASTSQPSAAIPWAVLAGLSTLSAIVLYVICQRTETALVRFVGTDQASAPPAE